MAHKMAKDMLEGFVGKPYYKDFFLNEKNVSIFQY